MSLLFLRNLFYIIIESAGKRCMGARHISAFARRAAKKAGFCPAFLLSYFYFTAPQYYFIFMTTTQRWGIYPPKEARVYKALCCLPYILTNNISRSPVTSNSSGLAGTNTVSPFLLLNNTYRLETPLTIFWASRFAPIPSTVCFICVLMRFRITSSCISITIAL